MHRVISGVGATVLLLTGGCTSTEPMDGRGERGDGVYRYVLGVDGERTIHGGSHVVVELSDSRGKFEAINDANRASRLHPTLGTVEYSTYDSNLTEGQTDWEVFASNWWPQSENGTAWRWQPGANQDYNDLDDRDRLSPLEKYDLLAHPGQPREVAKIEHCEYRDFVENGEDECTKIVRPAVTVAGPATAWELLNQGTYQEYDPENWWGHCNGWASYATSEPLGFPVRDVRVKLVAGQIRECASDDAADACMLFKMADIEALMTELYFSDQATFTGSRCNLPPDEIERDDYGRPTDARCRDMNAGSLHIAMTGLLARGARHLVTNEQDSRPAFVIDHNHDFEVWNFPLVEFKIRSTEEITADEANQRIDAEGSDYQFNPAAKKFIEVRATYSMVSDGVAPSQLLVRADQRSVPKHDVDLNYVLELDQNDRILGGEWIKDPKTTWGEDSRELHPDFAWMATDPIGWGENADDTGGSDDNPFVSYPVVQAILRCANEPASCGDEPIDPPDGLCDGNCGEGPFVDGSETCYCDVGCTSFGDCCDGFAAACGENGVDPDPTPSSCQDHCGESTAVSGSSPACYCDDACSTHGDCCADYGEVCGS